MPPTSDFLGGLTSVWLTLVLLTVDKARTATCTMGHGGRSSSVVPISTARAKPFARFQQLSRSRNTGDKYSNSFAAILNSSPRIFHQKKPHL
jgi:hypothetical protein